MGRHELVYILAVLPVVIACPVILWAVGAPMSAILAESFVGGFCLTYGYVRVREEK